MAEVNPILEIEGLVKKFASVIAVDGIDISVSQGDITFIIGPNGAGKTTFTNLVTGVHRPTAGKIFFNGDEITTLNQYKRAKRGIGRSFQTPELYPQLTAYENIHSSALTQKNRGPRFLLPRSWETETANKTATLLSAFGLEKYAETAAESLPHGVRKILDIAMVFATNPELVILDEPTSGVGTAEKQELMDTILEVATKRDVALLVIEHDMDIVSERADRVIAMHNGRVLVDGPPEEVLQSEAVMEKIREEGF